MNKLTNETSLYLQQHANNPVHWLPWNEESLALAKQQNKPVLLSIGYAACHWCQQMAHESFENQAIADMMNALYINIKVDRAERPDLDKIYQAAHSVLSGHAGGWPLTVFLNPDDRMPFFAGTYFPHTPSHGLPAFSEVLEHVGELYDKRQADIAKQSESLRQILASSNTHTADSTQTLNALPLDVARSQIRQQFDPHHGGFSAAPKFHQPAVLERCLRHWHHTASHDNADNTMLHAALHTLEKMAMGGIFDHLGGGFYRYATDDEWRIPHFEKMLYDNGPLLTLYTQAWCISKKQVFQHTACMTAEWIMREMQSAAGGYYSAQAADSEGREGNFYLWDKTELHDHIDADHWPVFEQRFGLDKPANFSGRWHLFAYESEQTLSQQFAGDSEQIREQLQSCCKTLFKIRSTRTAPVLDDTSLTAWNALMIKAMAHTGRRLNKPDYIHSAHRATEFIHSALWHEGRLFAASRDGHAQRTAYLDDYAFLLDALLEMLQCNWRLKWLDWAIELADYLLEHFTDTQQAGFFFTTADHEPLIQRIKSYADDAVPSGNAIAASALQRLGALIGNSDYLAAAESSLYNAWHAINQNTVAHCSMLNVLEEHLQPPHIIVLRGMAEKTQPWHQLAAEKYLPKTLVFNCPEVTGKVGLERQPGQTTEPGFLQDKTAVGEVCAYICVGQTCEQPIVDINEFENVLANLEQRTV